MGNHPMRAICEWDTSSLQLATVCGKRQLSYMIKWCSHSLLVDHFVKMLIAHSHALFIIVCNCA